MASPAELRRAPTTLARSKRNFSKNCQTKKKGKKKENRNTQRPELKLLGRTLVFFSFFFGASDESITKRSSRNKKYKKKAFFFLFKAFRGPVRGPPRPPFTLFLNLFNSIRVSSSARLSVVKKKKTHSHPLEPEPTPRKPSTIHKEKNQEIFSRAQKKTHPLSVSSLFVQFQTL